MKQLTLAFLRILGWGGNSAQTSSLAKNPQFIYVRIPEQMGPLDRQAKYGEPLDLILNAEKVGEVSGGGSMLSAPDKDGNRTVQFIGLDVDLWDFDRGLPILRAELIRLAVPKGTHLEYTRNGEVRTEAVK